VLRILGRRTALAMLAAVGMAAIAACSANHAVIANQKPVHPVKGQVLVGNQPAAGAFVLFVPVNEPQPPQDPRPRAEVKADGSFALSTYGEEDGAPAGEYIVTIRWTDPEDQDRLQGVYSDSASSKLRATVGEKQNDLPAFKL